MSFTKRVARTGALAALTFLPGHMHAQDAASTSAQAVKGTAAQDKDAAAQNDLANKQNSFMADFLDAMKTEGPNETITKIYKAFFAPDDDSQDATEFAKYLLRLPDDATPREVIAGILKLATGNKDSSLNVSADTLKMLNEKLHEINQLQSYDELLKSQGPDALAHRLIDILASRETSKQDRAIIMESILDLPGDANPKQIMTSVLALMAGIPDDGKSLSDDALQFLVDNGANLQFKNDKERGLVLIAAEAGNTGLIEKLHKRGLSVKDIDKDGYTAASLALFNHHTDTLKFVLNTTDPVDTETAVHYKTNDTLLVNALVTDQLDAAQVIVDKNPASINAKIAPLPMITTLSPNGGGPLIGKPVSMIVLEMLGDPPQQTKVFDFLVKNHCLMTQRSDAGQTLMHTVSQIGNIDLIDKLQKLGLSVSEQDNDNLTPVNLALERAVVVKHLLDLGAAADDTNANAEPGRYSNLALSLIGGQFDTARVLLDGGADKTLKINDLPLPFVMLNNSFGERGEQGMHILLEHQLDPNMPGPDGMPLMVAAARNLPPGADASILTLLASYGATPDMNNPAVANALAPYADDINLGRYVRSGFAGEPEDVPEFMSLAVRYGDVSAVTDALRDPTVASWFGERENQIEVMKQALTYNLPVFKHILESNPDMLKPAEKTPDAAFADTLLPAVAKAPPSNVLEALQAIHSLGGAFDTDKFLEEAKKQDDYLTNALTEYLKKVKDEKVAASASSGNVLENLAEPKTALGSQNDPLYLAVLAGKSAEIKEGLKGRSDLPLYKMDNLGSIGSLMHVAAANGKVEAAEALAGAYSFGVRNNYDEPPLFEAIRAQQPEMIAFLAEKSPESLGAHSSHIGWTGLQWAVDTRDVPTLKALLDAGILTHLKAEDIKKGLNRANDILRSGDESGLTMAVMITRAAKAANIEWQPAGPQR